LHVERLGDKPLSTEQESYSESNDDEGADEGVLSGEDRTNQEPPDNQTKDTRTKVRIFLKNTIWSRIWSHSNKQLICDLRVWIEIAALVTVICYTRYAGKQTDAMNQALAETRKQSGFASTSAEAATTAAKAAQDAIIQSRDQFIKDQRPYLWLSSGESKRPVLGKVPSGKFKGHGVILWDVDFTNYGRSPAHNVKIVLRVFAGESENDRPIPHAEWATLKRQVNGSKQARGIPLATNENIVSTATTDYSKFDITQDMFNSYLAMEYGIIVIGTVFYSDAGGNPYQTGFCLGRLRTGAVSRCEEESYIK
jgi:hypothetical protein